MKNALKQGYPDDLGLSSWPRTSSRASDLIPMGWSQTGLKGGRAQMAMCSPSTATITSALCVSPVANVNGGIVSSYETHLAHARSYQIHSQRTALSSIRTEDPRCIPCGSGSRAHGISSRRLHGNLQNGQHIQPCPSEAAGQ